MPAIIAHWNFILVDFILLRIYILLVIFVNDGGKFGVLATKQQYHIEQTRQQQPFLNRRIDADARPEQVCRMPIAISNPFT